MQLKKKRERSCYEAVFGRCDKTFEKLLQSPSSIRERAQHQCVAQCCLVARATIILADPGARDAVTTHGDGRHMVLVWLVQIGVRTERARPRENIYKSSR